MGCSHASALDDVALALFAYSEDGVLVTSPDGSILRANEAACRILRRPAEEILRLGRTPLLVSNDALARFLEVRARTGLAQGELTFLRPNGESFLVDCTSVVLRSQGDDQLTVVLFRDVSERHAAAEAQARLAAIVESSDEAIVSKDLDGVVKSWNRSAERIFGWRADEIVGRSILLIIPPDRRAEEDEILSYLRRGVRVPRFETVRLAKDGRAVDVSVAVAPVRDRDGRVIGASKIAHDITETKRAERQLREAREHEQTLVGLIPICMDCKQVRDDRGYWDKIEQYLATHTGAQLSHALCPACFARRCPADVDSRGDLGDGESSRRTHDGR